MQNREARVAIHMFASLDGFIARKDGSVDWLETPDHFEGGDTLTTESVEESPSDTVGACCVIASHALDAMLVDVAS